MTRKKRWARDLRKGILGSRGSQPPAPAPEEETLNLSLPFPGVSGWKSGWVLPWQVFRHWVRRPLSQFRLFFVCTVLFVLAKMTGIFMLNIAIWGEARPPAHVEKWVNAGLWEIFSWLLSPMALVPWLAAAVVFSHGLKVPGNLVKEIWNTKGRWLHLLAVGAVALVLAGATGAGAQWALPYGGWWVWCALFLLGWMSQVTLMVATVAVWQDGLRFHRALGVALWSWKRGWKAFVSCSLSALVMVGAIAAVVVAVFALPIVAFHLTPKTSGWLGFLLLPLVALLFSGWLGLRGALALAFYDWGTRALPPHRPSVVE